ncbi:peptidase M22, glycoprotease [Candidatus Endolissoclinum faulkneri L5]|uniref:Peptidase M22, glycoprotease n=1 Tax=Candidatus Endolissoclinum faulkneri L5 TaxID=1401328 RepID=V9TTB9_9PROT|nr:tRNA (adenosine(37)-N6)-threonylcarbamoyltransferase complex dimerization subunit type 1 TsaB [Candidatus Endolissoclinum faulkneri]AHC73402.1 peptidase M22, glycoprotease [Candidatus Endolissoclinum faulkneri L5]
MSLVLAISCYTSSCSVAVANSGKTIAFKTLHISQGHAEVVIPMIELVMADAGCKVSDIEAVAAMVGPGSFTGIRIGLAAAKGIALAMGMPTVPVDSITALAYTAGNSDIPLLVALDNKNGNLICQWFTDNGSSINDLCLCTATEAVCLSPTVSFRVAGNVSEKVVLAATEAKKTAYVVQRCDVPDIRSIAILANDRLAIGAYGPLLPIYLRNPISFN